MSLQNIELESLKKSFIKLSPELQEEFMEFALENTSHDIELTSAQKEELDKRLREIENGTIKPVLYSEANERIYSALCEKHSEYYHKPK